MGAGDKEPKTIEDLVRILASTSLDRLEEMLGPAALVGARPRPPDEPPREVDPWAYHTAPAVIPSPKSGPVGLFGESEVYGVKKAAPGPFADTVLVGRSASNDICIDDDSVSKLHARIRLGEDGSMTISEAGSTNGTMVNGRRLTRGEGVELKSGDQVVFGKRRLKLHATALLYQTLRGLVRRSSA